MTFDEWVEQNRDELAPLLRGDEIEALYRAWFAGYEAGLATMGEFAKDLWTLK
jgi:hypothetical protein